MGNDEDYDEMMNRNPPADMMMMMLAPVRLAAPACSDAFGGRGMCSGQATRAKYASSGAASASSIGSAGTTGSAAHGYFQFGHAAVIDLGGAAQDSSGDFAGGLNKLRVEPLAAPGCGNGYRVARRPHTMSGDNMRYADGEFAQFKIRGPAVVRVVYMDVAHDSGAGGHHSASGFACENDYLRYEIVPGGNPSGFASEVDSETVDTPAAGAKVRGGKHKMCGRWSVMPQDLSTLPATPVIHQS